MLADMQVADWSWWYAQLVFGRLPMVYDMGAWPESTDEAKRLKEDIAVLRARNEVETKALMDRAADQQPPRQTPMLSHYPTPAPIVPVMADMDRPRGWGRDPTNAGRDAAASSSTPRAMLDRSYSSSMAARARQLRLRVTESEDQ